MADSVKKLVKKTLEKYDVAIVNTVSVKEMIAAEGYTIIRFSSLGSSDQTERLLKALYLDERIAYCDSFTYNDRERRIVFIRRDISDDEFFYLLTLELGRILTYKDSYEGIIGNSANEDMLAHEFAYHVCDIANHGIVHNFFKNYTVISVISTLCFMLGLCLIASFFIAKAFIDDKDDVASENTVASFAEVVNEPEKELNIVPSFDQVPNNDDEDTNDLPADTNDLPADTNDLPADINDLPADVKYLPADANGTEIISDTVEAVPEEIPGSEEYIIPETEESTNCYYATKSGKKYHTADCGYIAGKTVVIITQSDIDSGKYSPCSKCIK